MRVAKYNKFIGCWVQDDTADALEHFAKANGVKVSAVIRNVLDGYFAYIGAIQPRQQVNGHSDEIRA